MGAEDYLFKLRSNIKVHFSTKLTFCFSFEKNANLIFQTQNQKLQNQKVIFEFLNQNLKVPGSLIVITPAGRTLIVL